MSKRESYFCDGDDCAAHIPVIRWWWSVSSATRSADNAKAVRQGFKEWAPGDTFTISAESHSAESHVLRIGPRGDMFLMTTTPMEAAE